VCQPGWQNATDAASLPPLYSHHG